MKILHFATSSGREPVREFIDELSNEARYEVITFLRRMEAGELLPMPYSRSLSSMAHGLYELRVRESQGIFRIFYYTKIKDSIFLLHALKKKSRIISNNDRDLILKRIHEVNATYKYKR